MTAEEAPLLKRVLRSAEGLPIGEIRLLNSTSHHWITLYRHLIDLRDTETGAAVENPGVPAMVDNWVRLGLVHVTYDKYLPGHRSTIRSTHDPKSYVFGHSVRQPNRTLACSLGLWREPHSDSSSPP